jgi:hypothetical protein
MNHVTAFVIGYYVMHMGGKPGHKDIQSGIYPYDEPYFRDTLNKTWGYLKGTQETDASCSDFQCIILSEAARVFGRKAP